MSIEQPKSGIVFYPDPLPLQVESMAWNQRHIPGSADEADAEWHPKTPASIARQIGVATNARQIADGIIVPGTAIALPYDSSIATKIHELHKPRGQGRRLIHYGLGIEGKQQQRDMLAEIFAEGHAMLDELGLAGASMYETFADRRIDMVANDERGYGESHRFLAAALHEGVYDLDKSDEQPGIVGHLWVPERNGAYQAVLDRRDDIHDAPDQVRPEEVIQAGHPLHTDNIEPVTHLNERHIITAEGIGAALVRDTLSVTPHNQRLVTDIGPGRRRVVQRAVEEVYELRIPHDQSDIDEQLEAIELRELSRSVRMQEDPTLSISLDSTFGRFFGPVSHAAAQLGKRIDPATDVAWSARVR